MDTFVSVISRRGNGSATLAIRVSGSTRWNVEKSPSGKITPPENPYLNKPISLPKWVEIQTMNGETICWTISSGRAHSIAQSLANLGATVMVVENCNGE